MSYKPQTLLVAFLVVLGVALPFLNKPFHIDDTVVLTVTEQIINNPLDPFGTEIDWFGYVLPMWESTTNPPFLSYYLAPFAWLSNTSEVVLHGAMMLFLFLLAWGMMVLGQRFTDSELWPILFAVTSPAVVVSGNVMRDVPALGLATAGIALFISGTDRNKTRWLFAGATLVGLATLTKYSSATLFGILVLYPIIQRKYGFTLAIWPGLLLVGLWCLQNFLYYGEVHILYLLFERDIETAIPWQDKLIGMLTIIGACLLLLPALIYRYVARRNVFSLILALALIPLIIWQVQVYHDGYADWQFLFWACLGGLTLFLGLDIGVRRLLTPLKVSDQHRALDSLFLTLWFLLPFIFSLWMVPFQAVRHFLPALPPFLLLLLSYLEREARPISNLKLRSNTLRNMLLVLLILQGALAFWVQMADSEYADVYRRYARQAVEQWGDQKEDTWYVGHWGWMYYMNEAGFRQLRLSPPFPDQGDILIVPIRVHQGEVFAKDFKFLHKQEKLKSVPFDGNIPIRTQNWRGASFYAVINKWTPNLPFRLFQPLPLERFDIYRITNPRPLVAPEAVQHRLEESPAG